MEIDDKMVEAAALAIYRDAYTADHEDRDGISMEYCRSFARAALATVPASDGVEAVAWLVDLDGTGSLHPAAEGDPGAFPVYRSALAAALATLPVPAGAEAVKPLADFRIAGQCNCRDCLNIRRDAYLEREGTRAAPPAAEAVKPYAWLCNGKGTGWEERDKIVYDPDLVANYLSRPAVWSVEPLYRGVAPASLPDGWSDAI